MSHADNLQTALDTFVGTWNDSMLALHIGPKLTCTEAEALADVLHVIGEIKAAEVWLEAHAQGDDEPDDLHHVWPAKHADPIVRHGPSS